MPLDRYFNGHGREVMNEMQKRYGKKKGERVFYATQNKRKPTYKSRSTTVY